MRNIRRFSQVFLQDAAYIARIAACLEVQGAAVLEIGPGAGALTEYLARISRRLYCLEIDPQLYRGLEKRFAASGNVRVIKGDVLRFSPASLPEKELLIFSNIPYQISKPLLMRLCGWGPQVRTAWLTVQKEFGQKIVGACGHNFLSCYVQYFAVSRRLFAIPAGAFAPAPKVDSWFIRLDLKPGIDPIEAGRFVALIKKAFAQPRKKVATALGLGVGSLDVLEKAGIPLNARPAEVGPRQYAALCRILL